MVTGTAEGAREDAFRKRTSTAGQRCAGFPGRPYRRDLQAPGVNWCNQRKEVPNVSQFDCPGKIRQKRSV